ncbi:hypothetical protein P7C71_g2477, partial [Lecanoromycetidae sp. Uapishka_2]
MVTHRWPHTDCHRPEDTIEHAMYLKTEFESVSNTANASFADTKHLPYRLHAMVSIGITKGIAEAQSNGFCPKWSENDKSIFCKVMLKTITNEAALKARDRIPLPQFNGLYESYKALYKKLATQMAPPATTHQFTGAGAGAATEATSVGDLVSAAKKTSEKAHKASNSLRMPTSRQEERNEDIDDEGNGEDANKEEEDETDESEDGESDQEVMGEGDAVSGDNSSEGESSDDTSGSEQSSETESDMGSEEVGDQGLVRGTTIPTIQGDGRSFSTTVNLKIEQQASVNRLEEMTTPDLRKCLSSSLKSLLHEQQLSSETMHISVINLLDNGDLRVVIHTEKRGALQQLTDLADWGQRLEKSLVCSQVSTYKVRMHAVEVNSLRFQNRKEKAAIIRRLAEVNRAISQANEKPFIRDIRWPHQSLPKGKSSLVIEFLDPEQATRALDFGLFWEKKHFGCKRDDNREIKRCARCQGYGHFHQRCRAPYRCGRCAKQHATGTCVSKTLKCASCDGKHRAGSKLCPVRAKEKRSLDFQREAVSQAIEPSAKTQATAPAPGRDVVPAARAQTESSMPSPVPLNASWADEEIKTESDQSSPEVDPTQDIHPDAATVLEKIEDLRKEAEDLRRIVVEQSVDVLRLVVERESALRSNFSGRTKRRAEEAFLGEAKAELSNMATKRIKKEQPTHEESMRLWRVPSPSHR